MLIESNVLNFTVLHTWNMCKPVECVWHVGIVGFDPSLEVGRGVEMVVMLGRVKYFFLGKYASCESMCYMT